MRFFPQRLGDQALIAVNEIFDRLELSETFRSFFYSSTWFRNSESLTFPTKNIVFELTKNAVFELHSQL